MTEVHTTTTPPYTPRTLMPRDQMSWLSSGLKRAFLRPVYRTG
jgi:hypothetical protein